MEHPSRQRLIPLLAAPLVLALGASGAAAAAEAPPTGGEGANRDRPLDPLTKNGLLARKGGPNQPVQSLACLDVPAHPYDLILGRPTRQAVTLSVLSYEDATFCIAYGTEAGALAARTPPHACKKGEPVELVLTALTPDTRYFYRLEGGTAGGEVSSFHTARPPGAPFTFTITADSHLDQNTDPGLYRRTLANARSDAPDFHVDLGDTFMTEKHENRVHATRQYLAQRFYLGELCRSAPLMFVLGNHDGEAPRGRDAEGDSLAVWANLIRKRYFPNPLPDSFYSGNATPHATAGLLQDYYAWTWGDARFIVLDPFWFNQRQRGRGDNWKRSLGAEQYQWLQRTLETGHPRFTFVFIHHLVGGADGQSRGGVEAVPWYEWGGRNADGSDGFQENRPGWGSPIHQLLVKHQVTAVFHGHDHLYAQQELDGMVYQEVPQPGHPGNDAPPRFAADYGYRSGTILGCSGHMRVTVTPQQATLALIRTDGSVAHTYALPHGAAPPPAQRQGATP